MKGIAATVVSSYFHVLFPVFLNHGSQCCTMMAFLFGKNLHFICSLIQTSYTESLGKLAHLLLSLFFSGTVSQILFL